MKKKSLSIYKQIICLFTLLMAGIISTTNMSAVTVTSFPPSDFWVVDHTTSSYTIDYGRDYNPNGIIGYKVDTIYNPMGMAEYGYQLTDTIALMTVALWNHAHQIDLNQDFELQFKLWFGTGQKQRKNPPNIGIVYFLLINYLYLFEIKRFI